MTANSHLGRAVPEPVICRTQAALDAALFDHPGVPVHLHGEETFVMTMAEKRSSRQVCVFDNAGLVLTAKGDAAPTVNAAQTATVRVMAFDRSRVSVNAIHSASVDVDAWDVSAVSVVANENSEAVILAHDNSRPSAIGFGDSVTAVMIDDKSHGVLKADERGAQSVRLYEHGRAEAVVSGDGKLTVNARSREADSGINVTLRERGQLEVRGGQDRIKIDDRRGRSHEATLPSPSPPIRRKTRSADEDLER